VIKGKVGEHRTYHHSLRVMKKKGKDEDIWTLQLEVKFYDLRKTNKGEGICLIVVH